MEAEENYSYWSNHIHLPTETEPRKHIFKKKKVGFGNIFILLELTASFFTCTKNQYWDLFQQKSKVFQTCEQIMS